MTDDAKRKRREYQRAYYLSHREQHKRNMAAYWERKAQAEAEAAQKNAADNGEKTNGKGGG